MAIIPWDNLNDKDLAFIKKRPLIDVYETDAAIITEISGFDGELTDLDISIRSGRLIIKGKFSAKKKRRLKGLLEKKNREESFERVIKLPAGANTDNITTTIKDGITHITVLKSIKSARDNNEKGQETL